jgi:hypothetical protein
MARLPERRFAADKNIQRWKPCTIYLALFTLSLHHALVIYALQADRHVGFDALLSTNALVCTRLQPSRNSPFICPRSVFRCSRDVQRLGHPARRRCHARLPARTRRRRPPRRHRLERNEHRPGRTLIARRAVLPLGIGRRERGGHVQRHRRRQLERHAAGRGARCRVAAVRGRRRGREHVDQVPRLRVARHAGTAVNRRQHRGRGKAGEEVVSLVAAAVSLGPVLANFCGDCADLDVYRR